MALLRYVLLCVTAAVIAWVSYSLLKLRMSDAERWGGIFAFILLLFNFAYLYLCPPSSAPGKSRLMRIGSLWLDAKEKELRDRAKGS